MLPFPEQISDFHRPKFLMTFFSHQPQISNFPSTHVFSLFYQISLCFAKIIISPLLSKISQFPPCFRKIHLLFTYFMCISFPPTLTVMHLCIPQRTYWTPLHQYMAASHVRMNPTNWWFSIFYTVNKLIT